MSDLRFFVDGEAVTPERYVVRADDPGFTVGLTVFETVRTYAGRIFRVEVHLDRLAASAESFGVPLPDRALLRAELAAAAAGDSPRRVRLTVTPTGHRLIESAPLDGDYVGAPLRVVTRPWEPPPWLGGRIKHGSRAFSQAVLRQTGTDEVLWVGHDGALLEGGRSSVFAVRDGVLLTPPDDGRILAGVTRQALLDAADVIGLTARAEPIPAADLDSVTELYASSTLKELSPIIEVDGRPAAGAGPVGAAVVDAFHDLVRRECSAGGSQ